MRDAAGVLRSLGASIVERSLPHAQLIRRSQRAVLTVDAATFHATRLAERPDDFGADVRERLRTATSISQLEYAQARHDREVVRRAWHELFREVDVILTPTTVSGAPPREGQDALAAAAHLTANTSPFNFTGLPAISVPCGFTGDGLPIGLQLAAGPWREALVLRAAQAYERETEWHARHPR